ncbi:PIN domain-containing protein [Psychroflexus sp. MBR-150]|jgi:predicted nucleic acid-binding protein
MIHSVKFIAVLDTNVVYPLEVRDLLFWFAYYDLFTPKWSKHIFDEWKSVMFRKNISEKEANKRIRKANLAFPYAFVKNYSGLINALSLPDKDDCHVLAAAIKTNANVIVTNNLKHFPNSYLASFGLKAKSADDFCTDLIDLNIKQSVEAFREMVFNKKNPNLDEYEVLDILRKRNLKNTADFLHSQL